MQATVPVLKDDTEELLAKRVLHMEHIIFPETLKELPLINLYLINKQAFNSIEFANQLFRQHQRKNQFRFAFQDCRSHEQNSLPNFLRIPSLWYQVLPAGLVAPINSLFSIPRYHLQALERPQGQTS